MTSGTRMLSPRQKLILKAETLNNLRFNSLKFLLSNHQSTN